MQISDVMGTDPRTVVIIEPRDTIADTVYILKEHSIGAVVVSNDGLKILGIISERDVVRHLALEHEGTLRVRVEDLMTENVSTCKIDDDIEAVMAVMTKGHFRHMPVVTADDDLCGLVSLGDLVDARLHELESQFKEIGDTPAD